MPLAPKSMPDVEQPGIVTEAAAIREQLERLLAHPLFANSKRYPALLAYTVEQTLLGNAAELKERSIAVEVFGRSPAYDANADPVVRITAGEVRKRLTQYYYDAAHRRRTGDRTADRLSYVPAFRGSGTARRGAEVVPVPEETAPYSETPPSVPGPNRTGRLAWWLAASAIVFVALAATAGYVAGRRYRPQPPPPSNIDRFWEPVTGSLTPTTFCLGEPAKNINLDAINNYDAPVAEPKPEPLYFRLHYSGHLALADVITLTRTVAALASLHKSFRVVPASEASFGQLREGPVVLIGAFDNIWTLRVTQKSPVRL